MAETETVCLNTRLRPFGLEGDLGTKASLYTSLRTFEDGFDRAQGILRTTASAWLLAALAALGTVIANDASCLADQAAAEGTAGAGPQPRECSFFFGALVRSLILLAASLGIASLWYLDQRVYMSLLHSVFVLGLRLEALDHRLPPIRFVMKGLNQDITPALSWFYQAPFLAFLALQGLNFTIAIALLQQFMQQQSADNAGDWQLVVLLVVTISAVLIQATILATAGHWPSLGPHGRSIDDLRFPAAPQSAASAATLQEQVNDVERRVATLEEWQGRA